LTQGGRAPEAFKGALEARMIQEGRTWVLAADGRRARLYVEPRRGAALTPDWSMEIGPEDRFELQDRPPRSFDRMGAGRHSMEGKFEPHEEEERRFLRRVAARVAEAAQAKAFDYLALAAPPRALGRLREALPPPVLAMVTAETAKDVLGEGAERMRERLAELRRS
jgi:protein required for attachment to host cells